MSESKRVALFLETLASEWSERGLAGPAEKVLLLPGGIEEGSADHLLFLTLPRVISGLYDEVELWERAGALWQDPHTRWLFDPERVAYADWREVETGLKTQRLAERRQDMRAWYEVARGIQGRFKGDVRALLEAGDNDVAGVITYLEGSPATFPFLSAEQTSRLWLDQMHRIGGVSLEGHSALRLEPGREARASLKELGFTSNVEAIPPHQFIALEVLSALPARKRATVGRDLLEQIIDS